MTGAAVGRSGWLGRGWERLRWGELADRLQVNPFDIGLPPCFRSFPYKSWPVNIAPPGEGSLDHEQFVRLVDQLGVISPEADRTECFAYYSPLATGVFDVPTVYRGKLRGLADLCAESRSGSPANIWPEDRSWFVYTDWDLWATKLSGDRELLHRALEDEELEAVVLDL
jgi:hypothetical protein